MKKKNSLITYIAFTAVFLSACSERISEFRIEKKYDYIKKEEIVDYRLLTVPEESGIRFNQISSEIDVLNTPYVYVNKGVIEWDAAWKIDIHPDGSKLAYIGIMSGKSNIYLKNVKGGRTTVQRTFKDKIQDVSFSHDGNSLVYSEATDTDRNVFQIDANQGAAVQQITNTSQIESNPLYSRDGKLIFFSKGEYNATTKSFRYFIWSFDRTTSILSQYCEGFAPCLSPDGKVLYFTKNNKATGLGEIWALNIISGQETQILADNEKGFATPKISPNGKTLLISGTTAATTSRYENLDIYTINTDGTNLTQLTHHPGHDLSAIWAPEGDEIYFISQRGNEKGNYGIWSMKYSNQ
jgi:Tol biopolymer transport system component